MSKMYPNQASSYLSSSWYSFLVHSNNRTDAGRGVQRVRDIGLQREPPGHRAAVRVHPHGVVQRDRNHCWVRGADCD